MFGLALFRRVRASWAVSAAARAPAGSDEALRELRNALRLYPGYPPALRLFREHRALPHGGALYAMTVKVDTPSASAKGFIQVFEVQARSPEDAMGMIRDLLDLPLQSGHLVESKVLSAKAGDGMRGVYAASGRIFFRQ